MMTLYTDQRRAVSVGASLASGGEGTIFAVAGDDTMAAKIYHRPPPEVVDKIRAMHQRRPPEPHCLCWPEKILYDHAGQAVGFLMRRVRSAVPLALITNPKTRVQISTSIDWRFLVVSAMNLMTVAECVHHAGCVIADVSAYNLLVNRQAIVWGIDCDSMQVPRADGNGRYFLCGVGTPEYTPPELHGQSLHSTPRTSYHDAFGLGVCAAQLLLGAHPFAGIWEGSGRAPSLSERIRCGHLPNQHGVLKPAPYAAPVSILPREVQELVFRCFVLGHHTPTARPLPAEWRAALAGVFRNLRTCARNGRHTFSHHLVSCPWCEHTNNGAIDLFTQRTTVPNRYLNLQWT